MVRGSGLMIVDGEERDVGERSVVLIRSGQQHAIRNTGPGLLGYVSATSPPFPAVVDGDRWDPA